MIEKTTRTTTREVHENGNTDTMIRTDARYTLGKINWSRVKHSDGSTVHSGTRSGWTFQIHMPFVGASRLTGTHEDGRTVRSTHRSVVRAKEAALFAMRPDEAMAWQRDTRAHGIIRRAAWDRFEFTHYGPVVRVKNRETGGVEDVPVDDFSEAREVAKTRLREVYGGPEAPARPEGPAAVAEALTRALDAAGIRADPKQLAVAAGLLAVELSGVSL